MATIMGAGVVWTALAFAVGATFRVSGANMAALWFLIGPLIVAIDAVDMYAFDQLVLAGHSGTGRCSSGNSTSRLRRERGKLHVHLVRHRGDGDPPHPGIGAGPGGPIGRTGQSVGGYVAKPGWSSVTITGGEYGYQALRHNGLTGATARYRLAGGTFDRLVDTTTWPPGWTAIAPIMITGCCVMLAAVQA
jgi:hypothetical protein